MILNIIDLRTKQDVFDSINAIAEGSDGVGYDEREHISVATAIDWASKLGVCVQLYLYDKDDGSFQH